MGEKLNIIITEKPSAAKTIKDSIFTKNKTLIHKKVKYYESEKNGEKYVIIPAVGHLFNLTHSTKTKPYFELEWKPTFEIHKNYDYVKPYLEIFQKFQKNFKKLIIATDYDTEGAVIARTILENVFKTTKAKRMKYSSFAKEELENSFKNLIKEEEGVVDAGITRHYVDYYFGVNISSELMTAIKQAGRFKIISIGRVQGPALKIIHDRHLEIEAFKQEDYFEIELTIDSLLFTNSKTYDSKKIVEKEMKSIKGVEIIKITQNLTKKSPPVPFNLTKLQLTIHNILGYNPSKTLSVAQKLYEKALISYPRTSSEKLPKINHAKLINKLLKQNIKLEPVIKKIFEQKELKPTEGKKTDPAHPAIHPTGESMKKMTPDEKKVYDIVLKNYLATFMKEAIYDKVHIKVKAGNTEYFNTQRKIKEKGYLVLYPHLIESNMLKILKETKPKNFKKKLHAKKTQPPPHYSQASLLKELEKNNLGTKATRSGIIKTMQDRGYFDGKKVEITEFGEILATTLIEHTPTIMSVELTKKLQIDLEKIEEGEKKPSEVLEHAKKQVIRIIKELKKDEEELGKKLVEAIKEDNIIGECPKCDNRSLISIRSKRTHKRFVACNKYPKCKTTFPLPQQGLLKTTHNICKECNHPIVLIINKGKRPWNLCINQDCKTKEEYKKKMLEKKNNNKKILKKPDLKTKRVIKAKKRK